MSNFQNKKRIVRNYYEALDNAPLDETVSIKEAEKMYSHAKHPKSFVSLDNADHLLSKAADAEYVANIITAWASRYITVSEPV